MVLLQRRLVAMAIVLAAVIAGCSSDAGTGENQDPGGQEESGTELGLNERYDAVRNGARLILAYDAQTNSFTGTVGNTTENTLRQVRVEVHLSNGVELGPTTPADLAPGERMEVALTATTKGFDGWTAHHEVGGGGGGEGEGEHGEEGEGEHREGGSD